MAKEQASCSIYNSVSSVASLQVMPIKPWNIETVVAGNQMFKIEDGLN